MFEIQQTDPATFRLRGRFDAAQEKTAQRVFEQIEGDCTLDCAELAYISSSGLGLLVALEKRLEKRGARARLLNLNPHIRELLAMAGLDRVLYIE
jgi:anti-anti-sigma factor